MINVKFYNFGLDCVKDLIIGFVIIFDISILYKDQSFVFVFMNLDLLVMFVWSIFDWRMLWIFDNRFLKNFVFGKIEFFKSYFLYFLCYVYDISFWLDDKKGFDELEFYILVRVVFQDIVIFI